METIKNYLDNLFAGYPKTEEVLHAKEELLANMEDKYNELKADGKSENEAIGIVISEFGNIDELAAEWNLPVASAEEIDSINVSREEAERFIEAKKKNGVIVGIGVMLCMLGVALMILVGCFAPGGSTNRLDITDAATLGDFIDVMTLLPLFVCIAIAVAMFIISGTKMEVYQAYEKKLIQLSAATKAYVQTEKSKFQTTFTIMLTLGVVLCILSPFTLISILALYGDADAVSAIGVAVLLTFIAIAVFLFIRSGEEMNAYKALLQEEDFSPAHKQSNKTMDVIGSIYWPIMVIIYLAWSFITGNWGFTWIIWPIAGILFGVIAAILSIINSAVHTGNR